MIKSKKFWLFIILLAIVVPRIFALWTPIIDVDEAIFANIANRMIDGAVPYVDMLDNKPMGIFYLYAAVFSIFGKGNMIAVHAVTMVIIAATCYLIYKIAELLKKDRDVTVGYLAALSYAIFSADYIPKMIATEIEIVMMLPLAAGVYLWLLAEQKKSLHLFILSGIFSGTGIILKYQAGIDLAIISLYWLIGILKREEGLGRYFSRIILFYLGYIVIPLVMVLHLHFVSGLEGFIMWTLQESTAYIKSGFNSLHAARQFFVKGFTCMSSSLMLWISAFWGIFYVFKTKKDFQWTLIILWFLLSFVPVVTGFRFYGHYFIQLMPAASLLSALIIVERWHLLKKCWRYLIIGFYISAIVIPMVPRFFTDQIYKAVGEDNPNDYRPIAEYIKAKTNESDFIYAWGFAPCIYFFSERNNASRFPFSNQLVGHVSDLKNDIQNPIDTENYVHPLAWGMLWEDFSKNPPKYIVDTATPNFHKYGAYKIERFKYFQDYLDKFYAYETTINGAPIYVRR